MTSDLSRQTEADAAKLLRAVEEGAIQALAFAQRAMWDATLYQKLARDTICKDKSNDLKVDLTQPTDETKALVALHAQWKKLQRESAEEGYRMVDHALKLTKLFEENVHRLPDAGEPAEAAEQRIDGNGDPVEDLGGPLQRMREAQLAARATHTRRMAIEEEKDREKVRKRAEALIADAEVKSA